MPSVVLVESGRLENMTPELIGIIGVGVALGGLIVPAQFRMNARLDSFRKDVDRRFDAVQSDIGELRERMARLEGLLEGFTRQAGPVDLGIVGEVD